MIARIKSHPTEKSAIVIDVPVEANKKMAAFQPARLDREMRGFVCLAEHLEQFKTFARFHDLQVIDERHRPFVPNAPTTQPHECRACAQPGSRITPPLMCPACGAPWDPVEPRDVIHVAARPTTRCGGCGNDQAGRFPYCGRCGAPMSYPRSETRPNALQQIERERLDDPATLAETLERVVPEPRKPRMSPVHVDGRPIRNVNLPDDDEDERPVWYDR